MLRERNERKALAWNTAALTRAAKMPKLDTILDADESKQVRRQSVEEQIAIAMQWTAATTR